MTSTSSPLVRLTSPTGNGLPVWVNPALVTSIDSDSTLTGPRHDRRLTRVDLSGPSVVYVLEPPEQVVELVGTTLADAWDSGWHTGWDDYIAAQGGPPFPDPTPNPYQER